MNTVQYCTVFAVKVSLIGTLQRSACLEFNGLIGLALELPPFKILVSPCKVITENLFP